jgi:acyl-CoA reductase-like NAD-dependent aldehyde dehydrogenase
MMEESFGPIIGIQAVSGDQEAVKLMNDTTYGLTAGIYTPNRQRAEQVLSQVNSGTVYWNACDRVSPYVPWTGRRGSGIGSTLGMEGIHAFLQPKSWHLIHPAK